MPGRLPRLIICLLFGVVTGATAGADGRSYGDLHWRFIGPFRGGRVLAVTGAPDDPRHFYFGAVNGGVWETRDAGRTWQPIFDDEPVGSIGAIAVAPSNPHVIYVGTGEADMRSDIAQGDGMFRSADAGRTWQHVGLDDSQQIARIIVHPDNPDLVYVAALGHPYGPNAQRGVFRSRDGGATWEKILGPDADTGAIDVLFEPGNPRVLYAALWQTRRTPWSVYPPSSGPGSGVYKSTDGGDHWTRIERGLPDHFGRVGLAISDAEPARVYAVVDAEPGGGLYRSDDSGASWIKMSGDTRVWQRGWYFGRITVHPAHPDEIYALNTIVLRSTDGGRTFVPLKGDPTGDDFHELWIDAHDPDRRILGVDQGTLVSVNGGATWSSWLNQPTAQFYRLATDNRFPYFVYGSQQDSGAAGVPSRTTGMDGINLTNFHEIAPGGENDSIAPDPDDPEIIYGGRVERFDRRTNQTRDIDPTFAHPGQHRAAWTLPLVFSRRNARVLYFGRQHLYRTEDGGERWTVISPDLTREAPGVPSNLDASTAGLDAGVGPRRGVIYAIAPSPVAGQDIWVGTDDGLVWRTRDEGGHWQNVTPPALTPWSKIAGIEASPHDADTAYVAVDRHRLDDFQPYVYRTTDGGTTWTLVAAGIAPTHFVNAIREDPVRRGLLFAGTERGMYVSVDAGGRWEPLQINLPRTSVRDLQVKNDDLVIATHGRGFWIMDDIAPLRHLDGEGLGATRLLAPSTAVRVRPEPFTGTPFPADEPAAENPPLGAYVDYVLATTPNSPVTLTIQDAAGHEVRRYRSTDAPPAIDLARIGSAEEWVPRPVTLSSTPGLHRFVWPIRYPAPPALARGNAFADGVWAPPGDYTVDLTVDGQHFSQPLTVTPDPRVGIPASAYAEQFALAKRIEADRARVDEAVVAASRLQDDLLERSRTAPATDGVHVDQVRRRLAQVLGREPATNPSSTSWQQPPALTSLRYLSATLQALERAVDGADAAPSPDARTGVEKTEALIPGVLASWDEVRRQAGP